MIETKELIELLTRHLNGFSKVPGKGQMRQMQLLPVVADDLNAAITAAFAAQVQNYEEHKGKSHIVTGFLK